MSVKLNSSGGGSVTLQEPTTASNFTLTLPAQTATVITDSSAILNIGSGQLYKDASGNVGVGSTSASGRLHVRQDQDGTTRSILHNRNSSGTPLVELDFITGAVDLSDNRYAYIQSGGGSSQYIAFGTGQGGSPTERARIDSSGNLLVGTTSAGGRIALGYAGLTSVGIGFIDSSTTGTTQATTFSKNGTQVGSIQTSNSATSYVTSSDYRLKNSVAPMTSGLATVSALKPVTYKWNADDSDGEGFIAHELQSVIPHAVTGEKDAVNEDGSIKPQGVDYSKIVVHLVAAIQELKADLDAAKAEIAALKGSA